MNSTTITAAQVVTRLPTTSISSTTGSDIMTPMLASSSAPILESPTDITSPQASNVQLPDNGSISAVPVFQDEETPHDWYCQAKDHERQDRLREATELFMKAAMEGHLAAMVSYALLHVPTDERMAFDWLRAAADRGHARAWYHLGQLFARGNVFDISQSDAACCWHRAAQLGDSAGRSALGLCYIRGFGVRKDAKKGVAIVKQVANIHDDVTAMKNLEWVFRNGKGVERNLDEANYWQEKAEKRDQVLEGANAMWSDWDLSRI